MKRHDLDFTSLVSGAVFVVVGALFLLDLTVDFSVNARWVAPLVLIAVGVAGLLSSVRSTRHGGDPAFADDDFVARK